MKKNKNKIIIILLVTLFVLLIAYILYKLIPLFISLNDPENQTKFKEYIESMGHKGWLMMLGIQVLQIFISFIPGEIVEILSGMLYGPIGGLFICLLGILIGSILIYYTVKLFANKNLDRYKEKIKTYSFLNNPKKIHVYFFILFLIPGLPKDIFIYLVPFLPIKFSTFLIISLIARIPSILSSTYAGNSLLSGNYLVTIIIFIIFGTLGILGILFNDKILALFKKHNDKDEKNIDNNNVEN